MKTTQNVATVSAQMIRKAVKDIRMNTLNIRVTDALGVLDGVAKELDQYAGAFEPEARTPA